MVYIRLKKVRFIASLFASWSKERRAIGTCNRCRVKRVKIILFVRYYLSIFVYTTGTFRLSDMIKTSQIIKGWANYDSLSRSWLYIPYFQKRFVLSRCWICFGLQSRTLFPFSTFHDKKSTRWNVPKNTKLKRERRQSWIEVLSCWTPKCCKGVLV